MNVDKSPDALATAQWLSANLHDPRLVVLDASLPYGPDGPDGNLGLARWREGHIPGARYADLQGALSDEASPFGFTFPQIHQIIPALEALGVHDGATVVIYDDFLNMWATRVWWMLRALGFDNAKVLDGGWREWLRQGLPVSSEEPPRPVGKPLTARARHLFSDLDDVLAQVSRQNPTEALVCALPESYFVGAETVAGRGGHIPGSINIPAASLLDAEGRFLPREQLRARLEPLEGISPVTIYCGGGISATVVAFALALIGREDVVVYDGSLEEWNSDPSRPLSPGAAK